MELEPLNKYEAAILPDKNKLNNSKEVKRDTWGNRVEFLLAIVGYTVGIGSVWRFPILCARNGGGAFLIPFFFFLLTCGGPLYYIEVCLGQFSGKSAAAAFEFCPLFKGLGLLMVLISFDILWYYVVIMGWIQYFFVNSFFAKLPWSTCGNWWNTPNCIEPGKIPISNATVTNLTMVNNFTVVDDMTNTTTLSNITTGKSMGYTSAASEFWMYNVLRRSSGLEDMGSLQWHLVLSNFIAWFLVGLALIKGVKSLGKVVYVTAIAPYVLLTILFLRGLMLDGARDGILWYLTPDFEKLFTPQVWLEAAIQVFYSLGPTYGGVITMASHNKFHQKSVVETYVCVLTDGLTAFYAGLVVFTCLGFMANESGLTVEEVAKASGPGLAFVAYPEAISKMPLPQLWAVLFFFMLITVAFDSTFGMLETVLGALFDLCPRLLVRGRRYFVIMGTALLLFLLSMPFCMSGGIFLFQLADWYVTAFALLSGSALEGIMVGWIYGADRFAHDIELMTGRKVSVLLRIFWCIVMTGFLSIAFFITVFTYKEPDYGEGYKYKPYAIAIGLIISLVPMLPVPVMMVREIAKQEGHVLQRIRQLLKPSEHWEPHDEIATEMYRLKPYKYEDNLLKRIKMNLLGDKETPWI